MIRVFFFLLIFCLSAKAQVDPEKLTASGLETGKWVKLEKSIRKALTKDTVNTEARYLMSLYYFNNGHTTYNIDSSYFYIQGSQRNYSQTIASAREKLKKIPLDSTILQKLREKVDSAAFEVAKTANTITGYQNFIKTHAAARQVKAAIELRDEVAFLAALKVNSWTSFQKFMKDYPDSHRAQEAEERFDKLLFNDKTKDQKLSSYSKFYQDYPESPYRVQTLNRIFELSTISGSAKSFQTFIKNYPNTALAKRARNILYTIHIADGAEVFDKSWMTDSLRQVEKLNQYYWVPVLKGGLFGFINERGDEVMSPRFESISADYLCGNITDHYILTSGGLLGRDGRNIVKGKINSAVSLGLGFIEVATDSGKTVIHESGFRIGKTGEGSKILANRFIGLQKDKKWSVYSLAGKQLLPYNYDDLESIDSLIVLTQKGKKILTTPVRLLREDKAETREQFVYDDLRRWSSQQYWVRLGALEGVMDANLNFLIPLDRQALRKTRFGFLREKEKKLYIQGIKAFENVPYQSVFEQANWVRMQSMTGEYIMYEKTFKQTLKSDSAWFQGQIAFMTSKDSINAYMPSGQKLSFYEKSPFRLMEFKDSSAWLVLSSNPSVPAKSSGRSGSNQNEKKNKTVYDATSGMKLFSLDFDQIEPVLPKIFMITKANKKGLISDDGKSLLPVEYDAIVSDGAESFSLLKEKKFGWYDSRTRQLMKPVYDRNVKPYNQKFRLAFKEKGYAFIKPDGTPLGNFEWEDALYWNDSTAWVKKSFQWMLLTISSQKSTLDKVRSYAAIKDTPQEKLFFVHQEHQVGVISNRRGTVIPILYSDVVNLGTPETPLYFTERHIEEAGISVVVYFDQHGKIVRKQAMESEEFDKIYCDN